MSLRDQKIEEQLRQLAANFLQRESNGLSLITVTHTVLLDKNSRAIIYITVLPENLQDDALDFTRRMRTNFREYVKKNSKIGRIPRFDFEIDLGEKNRQRIDELSLEQ